MMFCGMLGTFAGSVALTFGARGGVYIMGGIVPKISARSRSRASASGLNSAAVSWVSVRDFDIVVTC